MHIRNENFASQIKTYCVESPFKMPTYFNKASVNHCLFNLFVHFELLRNKKTLGFPSSGSKINKISTFLIIYSHADFSRAVLISSMTFQNCYCFSENA